MIYYEKPNNVSNLTQWESGGSYYNVWYNNNDVISLKRNYASSDIPTELISVLVFCENYIKNRTDFPDYYPVKYAQINFIYNDKVYSLTPDTFGIVFEFDFEVSQTFIRNKLKELGVKYSRYEGMLD